MELQRDVSAFILTLCTQTESLASEMSPLNFPPLRIFILIEKNYTYLS